MTDSSTAIMTKRLHKTIQLVEVGDGRRSFGRVQSKGVMGQKNTKDRIINVSFFPLCFCTEIHPDNLECVHFDNIKLFCYIDFDNKNENCCIGPA